MNFFRSDDHQVTLSQCWSLPCFTPISGSREAISPPAGGPVKDPLSESSEARVIREVKVTADTTVTPEA